MGMKGIGCSMLFTSVIVWCLIFRDDFDRSTAYAVATSVWFIKNLAAALNKEESQLGNSDVPSIVNSFVMALMIYGFENENWAPLVTKFGIANLWFHGLGFIFFTRFMLCKVYLYQEKLLNDPKHGNYLNLISRGVGIVMTQSAVFTTALELNVAPVPSFGLSCVVLALGLYLLPFDNQAAEINFTARQLMMATGCALLSFLMLREGLTKATTTEETSTTTE